MNRQGHTLPLPMNRTLNYDAVEILTERERKQPRCVWYKSSDRVPFLYISPKARVISSIVAVPLVGSITPKLQASLRRKQTSINIRFRPPSLVPSQSTRCSSVIVMNKSYRWLPITMYRSEISSADSWGHLSRAERMNLTWFNFTFHDTNHVIRISPFKSIKWRHFHESMQPQHRFSFHFRPCGDLTLSSPLHLHIDRSCSVELHAICSLLPLPAFVYAPKIISFRIDRYAFLFLL